MTMAETTSQAGSGIWPSFEAASRIADLANVAFIVSLFVGVIATVLIVWSGGIKEKYWDLSRDKSRERVAALELVAANANRIAAEATERTSAAEIKLNEIHREVGEREFDETKFLKRLENVTKRPVKVLHAADDAESFILASFKITGSLVHSGWSVYGMDESITPDIAKCAPFGDITVAVKYLSENESHEVERTPAGRTTTPWSVADALHQGLLNSRGVGVVTCPYITDDFLYILVSKKYIFLPKEQTKP